MKTKKQIYLDHNASTPIHPAVLEVMMPFLQDEFGNASSLHQLGQHARKAVEEARNQVKEFIHAEDADEIIFTSGGTESNNLAIKGILAAHREEGQRIISSSIEHSAVRQVLRSLSSERQIDSVILPVSPSGIVQSSELVKSLTPETILITIMAVNNEIGTLQPVKEISQIARQKNIPFHTDAVQAAGKIKIDVQDWGVDLLSISGHKIEAPKGVGVLYVRKGTRLFSLIDGGTQEKNRRGGTENVAAIVGLGKAVQLISKDLNEETKRLKLMRDQLESEILKQIPHTFLNGDPTNRVSNTSNIGFEFTDSSEMVMALDLNGLACSNGSACAAGNPTPSHVLLALGLPQDKAHASLRFSLGRTTTSEEIENAIAILRTTISRVRETHPLWKEAVGR